MLNANLKMPSASASAAATQATCFDAVYGGSKANVAVALCNYGTPASHVTRLPDNALGQAAFNSLRAHGVATDYIMHGGDRLGVYYLESGAGCRKQQVIYDRYDPETAPRFITNESRITVLSPESVYRKIIRPGDTNNCVLFDRMTEWSENGIRFKSVRAVHSDSDAIGVLIFDGDMTYYITGDTLYSEEKFEDIPSDIDVLFLPVNGVGNNMNMTDASRYAKRVNAKKTVPFHIGMFDSPSADDFECDNKVIPEIYKEIKL